MAEKTKINELRKFGIALSAALSLWGLIFLRLGRHFYLYFFAFSIIFLFLTLVLPLLLKPVHKIWMFIAMAISWLLTMLTLSVLFYLVITPIALLIKISGKDFLNRKFSGSTASYWIPKESLRKSDCRKQF